MMAYCRQPFVNLRIQPSRDGIEFQPCCHYRSKISVADLDAYLDSEEIKELRDSLISDRPLPPGCILCANQERKGQQSWRQRYNSAGPRQELFEISEIEVFMNNTCNLKCIMCDPMYSSALGAERQKIGWISEQKNFDFSDQIKQTVQNLPGLKSIAFIGGEFFFSKNSLEILDLVLEKNITAKIVTNATLLTQSHLDKLKAVKSVDIQVSLDGIGNCYEFIRYPAQWNQVERNIKNLQKILPSQKIHINSVIQALNFFQLPELLDWANQQRIPVQMTNLAAPSWLSWKILQNHEKTKLINEVCKKLQKISITTSQHRIMDDFYNTISNTEFDPGCRAEFIDKISQILRFRNISSTNIIEQFGCLGNLLSEVLEKMVPDDGYDPPSPDYRSGALPLS